VQGVWPCVICLVGRDINQYYLTFVKQRKMTVCIACASSHVCRVGDGGNSVGARTAMYQKWSRPGPQKRNLDKRLVRSSVKRCSLLRRVRGGTI